MDDLIDVFPFFEYPLVENHQTEAYANVLRFDPVPDYRRFSRFTIGQPNSKSQEKIQVNEGMVVTEPVNAFYDDILLGTYNHDLEPNSAEHFMDLSDIEGFLPEILPSNPSEQHIMDLDIVGRFPPQNLQSNPSEYLMDTINAGGYPLQNLQSNLMNSVTVGEFPPPMFDGNSNSVSLPVLPDPPIPFSCCCCHVLREIIHVNGTNLTKLEIHGTLGMISHAILENQYGIDCNGNFKSEYQMFDFCKKSIESVREFLVQYCEDRRLSGHELIQDPLLGFYEALCVGKFPDDFLDIAGFLPPPPPTPPPPPSSGFNGGGGPSSGANGFGTGSFGNANGNDGASTSGANANGFRFLQQYQQQQQPPPPPLDKQKQPPPAKKQQSKQNGARKSPLALQRERTGKLALGDLRGYFNLPMEVAARKINVCPTVMKKICRRGGLDRWPYRKVNSLERKIIAKTIVLNMKVGDAERVRVQAEIDALRNQINVIIADLLKES